MNAPFVFGLGILCAPAIYWLTNRIFGAAGDFLGRREKYAAGHFVRIMDARLEAGKRTSCRPLLSIPHVHGRSYVLALFKEGPNEPTAAETVREPVPFTEPLGDEQTTEEGAR